MVCEREGWRRMTGKRRRHSAELKAKVALEALKGQLALNLMGWTTPLAWRLRPRPHRGTQCRPAGAVHPINPAESGGRLPNWDTVRTLRRRYWRRRDRGVVAGIIHAVVLATPSSRVVNRSAAIGRGHSNEAAAR